MPGVLILADTFGTQLNVTSGMPSLAPLCREPLESMTHESMSLNHHSYETEQWFSNPALWDFLGVCLEHRLLDSNPRTSAQYSWGEARTLHLKKPPRDSCALESHCSTKNRESSDNTLKALWSNSYLFELVWFPWNDTGFSGADGVSNAEHNAWHIAGSHHSRKSRERLSFYWRMGAYGTPNWHSNPGSSVRVVSETYISHERWFAQDRERNHKI